MSKAAILGSVLSLFGTAVWLYGYLATGTPPLINWRAHTPWWIANYLPNLQAEIGMAIMCIGAFVTYWPARKE
jgi:hypothetical protein